MTSSQIQLGVGEKTQKTYNYADKLASLASHVVDLCYEMTRGLETTMDKNDITMCCLGGIQTESTQRVTRRAAYYVDIKNITTPEGRDMEAQMLREYLVNTCLHGNWDYLQKINDFEKFKSM